MRWLVLLVVASCGRYLPPVREADVAAWESAPKAKLEIHPRFRVMDRKVQTNSDGSELWVYTKDDCKHVFLVQGDEVAWYKPQGYCTSDCYSRPTRTCEN